ncbi:tRNA(Arg) A34 adenosine deaminase TadA [Mycobacterium frederiksbergense]|uniref:tRNA(Arg) A34 adenosine deaminase TadA n=1 Tax=Mycolicibacterium frederiksbergense TaxID=117567 RepID=A0ABT6KW36_9MYCO|nr:nucleoside deaminase [Mycolicibacterium frederiksbergense]MDH6194901.1 tRNA(Arg) A34 adenosine deaminase TadA [Mycolicibacterium frederiksbergense]
MQNLHRRTVLLGAGALVGLAGATSVSAVQAGAEPAPSDADLALLRRTFVLANEAKQSGSAPYGALVADADGNVVVERGNTSALGDGDPTQHAELVASADAWRVLGTDGMNHATLYASTEPCVMCAGAAYWTGIGRVVYGLPVRRLFEFTGDDPKQASFALPCRDILLHGQRAINVVGPLLEDEAAQPHEGFWG